MRFQLFRDCACSLFEKANILSSKDIGSDQAIEDAISNCPQRPSPLLKCFCPCKHVLFVLSQLLDFVSFVYMGIVVFVVLYESSHAIIMISNERVQISIGDQMSIYDFLLTANQWCFDIFDLKKKSQISIDYFQPMQAVVLEIFHLKKLSI